MHPQGPREAPSRAHCLYELKLTASVLLLSGIAVVWLVTLPYAVYVCTQIKGIKTRQRLLSTVNYLLHILEFSTSNRDLCIG